MAATLQPSLASVEAYHVIGAVTGMAVEHQCANLREAYQQNGFAVARDLVPRYAIEPALGHEGLVAALTVGRYGYDETSDPMTVETLPLGVKDLSSLNLIHNGHFLHAIRGLWPVIMSASIGAACLFGMLPESFMLHDVKDGPVSTLAEASPGSPLLRLNAHMKLAPKVPGSSDQHVKGHRDYDYWRSRLKSKSQEDRDAFLNGTVTAWIPLVSVDRYGSMVYGNDKPFPEISQQTKGVSRRQVPADPGDVLFHDLTVFHWSTLMQNTSNQVRWHVELRFHNAPVVDRLTDLNNDEMHQVMKGPAIEDVDTGRSYATLLEVIFQAREKIRWRYNAKTRQESLMGSQWQAPLRLPQIGLGTGRLWPLETIAPAMHSFLVMGGRHLDTAASYWSQEAVASVCRHSGVAAKDVVITTKIWPLGFKESLEAAGEALRQLDGVGQVVILLHSPGATADGQPKGPQNQRFTAAPAACRDDSKPNSWRKCRVESYMALASLRDAGVVSGIGVSNFLKRHLEELRRDLKGHAFTGAVGGLPHGLKTWPPDVVQHEVHLLRREEELLRYCRLWNITVVSYGTLGSPEAKTKLLAHPLVQKAAKMEGLAPAEVLMKWALQKGLHLIPTTSKVEHLQQLLELPTSAPLRRATVTLLESIPQWEAPIYHPYLSEIE